MRQKITEKLILTLGLAVLLTELLNISMDIFNGSIILVILAQLSAIVLVGWFWITLVIKTDKKNYEKMEAAGKASIEAASFEKTYKKICDEHKDYLEAKRRMQKNKKILKYILLGIGILQIVLLLRNIDGIFENGTLIYWVIAAASSMGYILLDSNERKTTEQYKDAYKQRIVTALVKSISAKLKYRKATAEDNALWSEYYTADFGLLTANKIKLIDKIDGTYKEKRIDILKIDLENEEQVENRTTVTPIFNGLFARTITDKNLNFKLKVCSVGVTTRYDISEKGLKNIKIDNGNFMDNFMVEGTDKMLAMRILTSEVVEMLLNIKEKYGITLDMIINNDKVYFLFYTPNIFEPNVWQSAVDKEVLIGECSVLKLITDLIQKLNNVIADIQL